MYMYTKYQKQKQTSHRTNEKEGTENLLHKIRDIAGVLIQLVFICNIFSRVVASCEEFMKI